MKAISQKLTVVCLLFLALSIAIVVLYETDTLASGLLADDKQSEFIFTFIMELLSLGGAFLGLRLFKFAFVHDDLVAHPEPAMLKWGVIRLLMIEVPMLTDTLLYYIYMNTTFGYLGIMLLLCLPFVFPSKSRCEDETEYYNRQL
jgi:hypothetical protein